MAGLDYFYSIGRQPMSVARDDQTLEERAGGPMPLDCHSHRCRRLARTDHQGPARGRRGQMPRQDLDRVRGRYRRTEASNEKFFRVHV